MVDLEFNKDFFLKKSRIIQKRKFILIWQNFLPSNYQKIIPQLKERLISISKKVDF